MFPRIPDRNQTNQTVDQTLTTPPIMANPSGNKRVIGHVTEATGYNNNSSSSHVHLPGDQSLHSVRHFGGTVGDLISLGPGSVGSGSGSGSSSDHSIVYSDFDDLIGGSSALLVKPKPYYDPADDFLMSDGRLVSVCPVRAEMRVGPKEATAERSPIRSTSRLTSPPTPSAGQTFIMRKGGGGEHKETSVNMDHMDASASFNLPPGRPSCFDIMSSSLSPHLESGFGVDSYTLSVDHSPISSISSLAESLAPQVRGADSSCDRTGNEAAMVPFNAHTHALQLHKQQQQQQMMMYKNNSPWPLQSSSPSELQLGGGGGGGVGVPEDPCSYAASYDVNQTSAIVAQRKVGTAYPGTSQRLCVICGDEASGCHYGVITCGSCKVFFKRAVEGPHNYLCAGRNDCIVDKIRRKNCPSCRLRNCYLAGMKLGGRKIKRAGVRMTSDFRSPASLMFQGHHWATGHSHGHGQGHHPEGQHQQQTTLTCSLPGPAVVSISELQLHPQIITLLEDIEPDTVLSECNNSNSSSGDQPDVESSLLLSCLNRLCERQLVWIVRWSKALPGFRNLHIDDQMKLIQYSWMNLLVFSLGWRSFQNVTSEYLYFAPDLVLSQEQMKRSPIYDLCLAMQLVPQEFRNLQVTREEFLCMKVIMLLTTVPLEGLKSQSVFEDMRQNYIRELYKTIYMKNGALASSQRFYHLTKLMDAMHEIVKKMNLYCLTTFIQADAMKVEFPEMMTEVISTQLPKVLAGMVKPLLFHQRGPPGVDQC